MNKYFYQPYAEIELRLGKKSGSSFLSNIGYTNYIKIKKCLDSFTKWQSIQEFKCSDEFFGDVRKSNDIVIQKKKLYDNDMCLNSGFSTRFVISQEIPLRTSLEEQPITYIREKNRSRYEDSHWYVDLTHITNLNTYELEIELKSISYAKKHSYEYINSLLSSEMNNLISCANL